MMKLMVCVTKRIIIQLTLPDDVQSTRCLHSTTATTLGPGLVEVIMFGGIDDFKNRTLIAATTILRFSKSSCYHCPKQDNL